MNEQSYSRPASSFGAVLERMANLFRPAAKLSKTASESTADGTLGVVCVHVSLRCAYGKKGFLSFVSLIKSLWPPSMPACLLLPCDAEDDMYEEFCRWSIDSGLSCTPPNTVGGQEAHGRRQCRQSSTRGNMREGATES